MSPNNGLRALDRNGRPKAYTAALPGDVLVVSASADPAADQLRRWLGLRRSHPASPLLVEVAEIEVAAAMELAASVSDAAAYPLSANWKEAWNEVVMRLGSAENQPDRLSRWLQILRPDLTPQTLERVEALVEAGARCATVLVTAAELGTTPRNLEDSFARAQLAPPGAYARFGRLTPGLHLLSLCRGARLIEAADAAGYSTPSGFLHALKTSVHCGAGDARSRLGFEWVAHAMGLHWRGHPRGHRA